MIIDTLKPGASAEAGAAPQAAEIRAESWHLGGRKFHLKNTPKYPPECTALSARRMERVRTKTPTNQAVLRIPDKVR
ncbi:hypothetical protein [Sphingomonas aerolata]|uniref:hypothetical protein n=1 Tax=Sphingomonas aerolata TaxID=185951 RepID=UPI003348BB8E